MSTQTSLSQREELAASAEWREEVADRLKAHRARRRQAAGGATLPLDFDPDSEFDIPDQREELKRVRAERRSAARIQLAQQVLEDFHPSNTLQEPGEGAAEICELAEAVLQALAQQPEPLPLVPSNAVSSNVASSNIIEFPRQLLADRLPEQLVETSVVEEEQEFEFSEMQLRIFEADSSDLSIPSSGWAGIRLDEDSFKHPHASFKPEFELPLQVAPLGQRLTCHVADGVLVMGACAAFAVGVAFTANEAPERKNLMVFLAIVPVLLWSMYHCIFLSLGRSTPGMNYARLGICNFEDGYATRTQRLGRAFASIVSLVSLGMGYLWVFADEDGLGWHDRMTRTYLREMAGSHDGPPEA